MIHAHFSHPYLKNIWENILIALTYWGVSHVNFMIFKAAGVLPMPIWPAAALALVTAFYRNWAAAPGIAAGTILANHFSLSAPLQLAVCIAVMNTLGPLAGASLMRRRVTRDLSIRSFTDVLFCFLAGIIAVPVLTASGGIGSRWMLDLIPDHEVMTAWLKWFLAHSLGTLIFAVPVFAWIKGEPKP